ncbi:MAG: sigma-70 family RNA polymerase sigma factor [Dehalococcoidia bacterium]|nr:sigma-70 family RNA polymerase sigma factor [Dehalococcoidia bacterium]
MVSLNAPLPRSNDDTDLVLRAIGRDEDAFAELYERHVVRVYRHIYYMLGNAAEAEDLTSQTFLRAWEAIERYQVRGAPFVSWLLRIAHNLGVSHLRAKRESSQLHDGIMDDKMRRDPEASYQQTAEEELVREAILHLRDEQRQVIILRFIEDLDYREVAEIIGKSVAAIRVIQHRALNALRKQMKLMDPAV